MMVYRYLNLSYGLDALQTGTWKVGRLDKLNDIFDCYPQIRNLPGGFYEFEDNYLRQLSGVLGLICFAATINDPVIWSHYANVHQGLALGFEFNESDPDYPHKIEYEKCRPILDFATIGTAREDRDPDEAKRRLLDAGFTTKHPSWSYEQEYRQFVLLDGCRMKGEHYFRPLLWHRLKEIVLGARCPVTMQDIKRIIDDHHADALVKEQLINLPRPEVRRCQIDRTSFDLAFETLPREPSA